MGVASVNKGSPLGCSVYECTVSRNAQQYLFINGLSLYGSLAEASASIHDGRPLNIGYLRHPSDTSFLNQSTQSTSHSMPQAAERAVIAPRIGLHTLCIRKPGALKPLLIPTVVSTTDRGLASATLHCRSARSMARPPGVQNQGPGMVRPLRSLARCVQDLSHYTMP